MKIGGHEITVSNRDRVFFPEAGLTKGDVVDYYARVAEVMLRHVRHHPVSMLRYPDGLQGEGFYQKDTPDYFPDWIDTVVFPRREDGSFRAPVINSKATLVYLANQACLTPHIYLSRADDLERPDRMIFDLDPPKAGDNFATVRRAALDLRELLEQVGLSPWVMTTGSKGLHVVVPLRRVHDFDTVRRFAHDLAEVLVRRRPELYTLQQRKNKRAGRLFLDVLRNSYGATAVAPYAVRARPGAPVATPLQWEEVHDDKLGPRNWTIENLLYRLEQRQDPWGNMMRHARSLETPRRKLDRLAGKRSDSSPTEH